MKEKLWNKDFIIACITYFLFSCAFQLLMPTLPIYLSEELGVATSKIGLVLASYGLGLLLIRPFSGYLVDVYPRVPLLITGMVFFVAIFTGYYFVVTVLIFVILRFVHGLFWGLSTVSINTVAIDIIPASRRAEGIGYFGVTMNLAMAIAPYIAIEIYDAFGFQMLVTSSLIMGTLGIITAFFLKVPPREKHKNRPKLSFDRFILIKAVPIFLNQLLLAFGIGTLIAYAVLYGKTIGLENSGLLFLFIAAGNILSRANSGKFVDRGHAHKVIAIAILIITIGFAGFALLHNIYFFLFSTFLLGVGQGTVFPALQTLYVNMAPASKRGTANSTYLTAFDIGIGSGMLIGAYFADLWGYSNMYLIVAGITFGAFLIYWFNSRRVYEKYKVV